MYSHTSPPIIAVSNAGNLPEFGPYAARSITGIFLNPECLKKRTFCNSLRTRPNDANSIPAKNSPGSSTNSAPVTRSSSGDSADSVDPYATSSKPFPDSQNEKSVSGRSSKTRHNDQRRKTRLRSVRIARRIRTRPHSRFKTAQWQASPQHEPGDASADADYRCFRRQTGASAGF